MLTVPLGESLASTAMFLAMVLVVVALSELATGSGLTAAAEKLKSSTPSASSLPVLSVSCQWTSRYWPGAQLIPATVTGAMTVRLGAESPTSCVLLAAVVLGDEKLRPLTAVLPVV